MKNLFLRDLQVFGEGGDGGASAAPAGDTGAGTSGSGVTAPAAGVQEQTAQPAKTPDEEFEELIAGKFKDQFTKRTTGIVSNRLRGKDGQIREMQKHLDRANGLLRTVGSRAYGMAFGDDGSVDYDAFQAHVDADREMVSKAAAKEGLSDEAYLERERYRAKLAALQAENRQQANQAFYERVMQQGEAAKEVYPTLDVAKEMDNPAFATLIRSGFSVKNAYESVHFEEILAAKNAEAARAAELRLSSTIQAKGARPAENGVQRQAASNGSVDPDPRKWTKEYRAEIRKQTMAGHPPSF